MSQRFLRGVVSAIVALLVLGNAAAASADAIDDFVTRFYQDVLDRQPDSLGLAGWNEFLRANCNTAGFDTLARGFFGSPEFLQTKALTMSELVAKLYVTFLGRGPDAAGLAGWADVFRQARLRVALNGFVPSAEFQGLLPDRTDRQMVTAVVTGLYTEILNRAPDPQGLQGWVDAIVATGDLENVARGFLASAEFEGRPLTFRDYVRILYRTFLFREPDPAGLAGWEGIFIDALFQVINAGFVPSPEFQSKRSTLCPSVTSESTPFQFGGLIIESFTLFELFPNVSSCALRVTVRNPSDQLRVAGLFFDAFNAAGNGIAFSRVGGPLPPNSTNPLEQIWANPTITPIRCSEIARVRFNPSLSNVL